MGFPLPISPHLCINPSSAGPICIPDRHLSTFCQQMCSITYQHQTTSCKMLTIYRQQYSNHVLLKQYQLFAVQRSIRPNSKMAAEISRNLATLHIRSKWPPTDETHENSMDFCFRHFRFLFQTFQIFVSDIFDFCFRHFRFLFQTM